MERVWNKAKSVKIFASVFLALLFVVVVWKKAGIYFETNDDKFITEILSGTLSGKPDAHAIHINYLLAWPLSLLYRISTDIPWYGGMLVICHFLVYIALLQSIWSKARSILEFILLGGMVCCYMLLNCYITASIQFTSTAALMAATGYVCLLQQKHFKKELVFFFAFELAAFLIRSKAMLMIQPLGAAVCTGYCLVCEREEFKLCCRRAAKMIMAVVLVLAIGYVGNLIGYRGEGWDNYKRFDAATTDLLDFYGVLNYEEVKHILNEYGVTKAEYEAFCNYCIMDWDVSVECMEALADYTVNRQPKELRITELLKQTWNWEDPEGHLGLNRISRMMWAAVFLWILLRRRFWLLIPVGGMAFCKTIVWGYLIYKGRLPLRVTVPLTACEIMLLTALLVREYASVPKDRGRKLLPLLFCLFCGVFAYNSVSVGREQYRRAVQGNEWQDLYMQGLVEVQEYCEKHAKNRYILDLWSFSYYRGNAFETRIYGRKNYVYSGSWFSNSPPLLRHLKEYFQGNNGEIYVIVADEEGGGGKVTTAYFAEKFGRDPVLADRIEAAHGGSYVVWKFGGDD